MAGWIAGRAERLIKVHARANSHEGGREGGRGEEGQRFSGEELLGNSWREVSKRERESFRGNDDRCSESSSHGEQASEGANDSQGELAIIVFKRS